MSARHTKIVVTAFVFLALAASFLLRHPASESKTLSDASVRLVRDCAASIEKEACLVSTFETYARSNGVKNALDAVHLAIMHDQSFGGTCHNIMHHIGHVALVEYGSFEAAYREGNYDCGNGYFHGVVEEVFRGRGDDALDPAQLGNFCDSVKTEATTTKDYSLLNCVHGLGHALVYKDNGELTESLPACMSLKADNERTECIAGAFMENMIERLSIAAQSDPKQNPSLTCSSVPGDLYRCWAALAGFVLSVEHGGVNDSLHFCRGFSREVYREACSEGIGRAVRIGRGRDGEASELYCRSHTGELSMFCSRGASELHDGEDSPFYSLAFGMLAWPSASGTDPLIGSMKMTE